MANKEASTENLHLHLPDNEFTIYEKARIIGSRALQIAQGAKPFIKISDEELEELKFNPIEVAKKEFNEGAIPISVKRSMPKDTSEKAAVQK
ncbi:MAG: DNA-directed RNA polymerase subunit K [Candidatus Nanoarchaeia archaeon]